MKAINYLVIDVIEDFDGQLDMVLVQNVQEDVESSLEPTSYITQDELNKRLDEDAELDACDFPDARLNELLEQHPELRSVPWYPIGYEGVEAMTEQDKDALVKRMAEMVERNSR